MPDSGDEPTAPPTPAPTTLDDPSQSGEVSYLRDLMPADFPTYLVDVGAYDGATLSNSAPFLAEGWSGVVIEPHPSLFARLAALHHGRDDVACVNKAVAAEQGVLPLFLGVGGEDSMVSTLSTDENRWFESMRTQESVEVEVDTLTSILDSCSAPGDFALLLVDAEGMDYDVLAGLDFERYRPRVIVTEEYRFNLDKHNGKFRLLLDQGYAFVNLVGANTIWVANEWAPVCLRH